MNKKILLTVLLIVAMISAVACTTVTETVSQQESKAVNDAMTEMNNQVGMPFIDDFYEKKMAKQIFELRDNANLITYAYMVNLEGQYVYLGRCMGFGLPYSTQYTNPNKIVDYRGRNVASKESSIYYEGNQVVAQADPNGLYMPTSSSATWLMLINEESGEPEVIYVESEITVTQSKLPKRLVAPWSLTKDY